MTFCLVSNKSKNTILFLFSDFLLSHTFFPYVPPSLNLRSFRSFFPFSSLLFFHSFFLLSIGLFHFISSMGTLAVGEDCMDCYCFFFAHYFFLFIVKLFSSSSSSFSLCFPFLRVNSGEVALRHRHRRDLVKASSCQALCSVALGDTPPL